MLADDRVSDANRHEAAAAEERLKVPTDVLRYALWLAAYWALILLLAIFVSSFVNWVLS